MQAARRVLYSEFSQLLGPEMRPRVGKIAAAPIDQSCYMTRCVEQRIRIHATVITRQHEATRAGRVVRVADSKRWINNFQISGLLD